jgi:type III restriction enzyme
MPLANEDRLRDSVKTIRTAQHKGWQTTVKLTRDAKIECARKFFASLDEKHGQDVKYDVVTDYAELMQLVAG